MSNNYYDNQQVEAWLLEYQNTAKLDEEGNVIWKNQLLEHKITLEVQKVVDAIINQYGYYKFESRDDLQQHAVFDCYKNYMKFKTEKGTSFNFFSLIAKVTLLNFTTRKKKHRMNFDIEDQVSIHSKETNNFSLFIQDLERMLYRINDENFLRAKRRKQNQIIAVLIDYLNTHRVFVGKQHMNNYFRSFGIKSNEFRDFIKEMAKYNPEIFNVIEN